MAKCHAFSGKEHNLLSKFPLHVREATTSFMFYIYVLVQKSMQLLYEMQFMMETTELM